MEWHWLFEKREHIGLSLNRIAQWGTALTGIVLVFPGARRRRWLHEIGGAFIVFLSFTVLFAISSEEPTLWPVPAPHTAAVEQTPTPDATVVRDSQSWRAAIELRKTREALFNLIGQRQADINWYLCEATIYIKDSSPYAERAAGRIGLILEAAGLQTKQISSNEHLREGIQIIGRLSNDADGSTTCAEQVNDALSSIFGTAMSEDVQHTVTPRCRPIGNCIEIDVGDQPL